MPLAILCVAGTVVVIPKIRSAQCGMQAVIEWNVLGRATLVKPKILCVASHFSSYYALRRGLKAFARKSQCFLLLPYRLADIKAGLLSIVGWLRPRWEGVHKSVFDMVGGLRGLSP